ncbi:hypothetical protein ACC668_37770, partial [Rhizobium ruizarguesonis]
LTARYRAIPLSPRGFSARAFLFSRICGHLRSDTPEEAKVKKSRARQYEVNESKHFIYHNDALMHPGRTKA